MRISIVGATGAVGTIMRRLARERFPAAELVAFASERSVGKELDDGLVCRPLADDQMEGFDLALLSAGGATSREWAPRFAGGRRAGGRQLQRVADGPARPARRQRGQSRGDGRRPQGHRRQPELHDDGRDASGQGAARPLRPHRDGHHELPGRGRGGAEGHRRADRPGRARRPRRPAADRRRRGGSARGRTRDPREHAGLQRRAAPGHARRQRLHRRGDEAPERVAQDPLAPRARDHADLRARPGRRRALDRRARDVRRRARPRRRARGAARLPEPRRHRGAHAAGGRRAQRDLRRSRAARSRPTRAS